MKTAVLAGWEALSPADRAPYKGGRLRSAR